MLLQVIDVVLKSPSDGADVLSPPPASDLGRPIRVVLFCGPVLERGMIRFAHLLESHPEVDLVGAFCQSSGLSVGSRVADLFRRRGVVAVPLAILQVLEYLLRWVVSPSFERRLRRSAQKLESRLEVVSDLHDADVLSRVRSLSPDLGLVYGGPILRPQLFTLPAYGTLGIHHGQLPQYRGKKTTFWALYNDAPTVGVTIQRINSGIDTGELVRAAQVATGTRSYRALDRELEEIGLDVYLDSVVAWKRGNAIVSRIPGRRGRLYRDPVLPDLLRLYLRRLIRQMAGLGSKGSPAERRNGVLLLTESYHPMLGGGENQARQLARCVSAARDPVTVVTRRWDHLQPRVALVDGIQVRRIAPAGSGHLKKWGLALTLIPQLIRYRADHGTALVCGFRVMGIPVALLGPLLGMRVILKAESVGEMSGDFFANGLLKLGIDPDLFVVRWIMSLRNRILRRADVFVSISEVLRQEFEDHGVPRNKIVAIPNGVDTQAFAPSGPGQKARLRQALGLPVQTPLAVYAGRLVSYKGLFDLVDAWRDVAQSIPEATLVLVGAGGADIDNCERELRDRVAATGLGGRIIFVGAVSNVQDYLKCADVFVFPSRNEAFGLSVIEAMAAGLPVVSSRAGGLADIARSDNGVLPVEAGNPDSLREALVAILRDETWRRRLGQHARDSACALYDHYAVGDRYLQLFA